MHFKCSFICAISLKMHPSYKLFTRTVIYIKVNRTVIIHSWNGKVCIYIISWLLKTNIEKKKNFKQRVYLNIQRKIIIRAHLVLDKLCVLNIVTCSFVFKYSFWWIMSLIIKRLKHRMSNVCIHDLFNLMVQVTYIFFK